MFATGDRVRTISRVHGPMTGEIVRVTRWRHKVYYHVDWQCSSGDQIKSKELAGRDDRDWEKI